MQLNIDVQAVRLDARNLGADVLHEFGNERMGIALSCLDRLLLLVPKRSHVGKLGLVRQRVVELFSRLRREDILALLDQVATFKEGRDDAVPRCRGSDAAVLAFLVLVLLQERLSQMLVPDFFRYPRKVAQQGRDRVERLMLGFLLRGL